MWKKVGVTIVIIAIAIFLLIPKETKDSWFRGGSNESTSMTQSAIEHSVSQETAIISVDDTKEAQEELTSTEAEVMDRPESYLDYYGFTANMSLEERIALKSECYQRQMEELQADPEFHYDMMDGSTWKLIPYFVRRQEENIEDLAYGISYQITDMYYVSQMEGYPSDN